MLVDGGCQWFLLMYLVRLFLKVKGRSKGGLYHCVYKQLINKSVPPLPLSH